jgi:hypothetical protein
MLENEYKVYEPLISQLSNLDFIAPNSYKPMKINGQDFELKLKKHSQKLEDQMKMEGIELYRDGQLDLVSLIDAFRIQAFTVHST